VLCVVCVCVCAVIAWRRAGGCGGIWGGGAGVAGGFRGGGPGVPGGFGAGDDKYERLCDGTTWSLDMVPGSHRPTQWQWVSPEDTTLTAITYQVFTTENAQQNDSFEHTLGMFRVAGTALLTCSPHACSQSRASGIMLGIPSPCGPRLAIS
jgi:hypothetical protein